jgi:hypothetical protein
VDQPDETTLLDEESLAPEDAPEEESQDQPRLVNIRYNGNTYEMPEPLADAWHQREQEFLRRLSEPTRRQQREAQSQPQQPQQTQVPQPNAQDADLEFWQKGPSKVLEERDERLQRVMREEAERVATLNEQRRLWWSRFWDSNADLRGRDKAVAFIVQQHGAELGDLDEAECHDRMATLTRDLLGLDNPRPPTRGTRTLPNRQVVDERTSNPPRRPASEQPQRRPKTGIEIINERKEARRRAALNLEKVTK